ncbi:AhpC/TSA family protein [Owenweeksia hongkongensis DSM 17368]|uniref:AhpC/TSA family protein n=1 Tax=Owenweeksia hongkongensis (strain DSM 17368 / CIP 108786 / JCM 12287 / NRRL B-23963 / UST20020801) TaxID=926562 RepID=G8R7S0_OWEHD|nr:redoxin domain-containing protein [Owenweeksia hongkongensis]AEV33451.1 AhpC/TSA family protein [Owenweeksia hongkongensis DSM 17368]
MMKGFHIYLILISVCLACTNQAPENISVKNYPITDTIPIYDFEDLEPLLYTNSDTTYMVNFWAMWCAPCVKELPYFVEYAKSNRNQKTKVIYISLDFPKDIDSKIKPFLKRKNITSKVILLDDPDSNYWIDEIDPNWSGAIPFTIVFNKEKREYFERSFESLQDLENTIHKHFNTN